MVLMLSFVYLDHFFVMDMVVLFLLFLYIAVDYLDPSARPDLLDLLLDLLVVCDRIVDAPDRFCVLCFQFFKFLFRCWCQVFFQLLLPVELSPVVIGDGFQVVGDEL